MLLVVPDDMLALWEGEFAFWAGEAPLTDETHAPRPSSTYAAVTHRTCFAPQDNSREIVPI